MSNSNCCFLTCFQVNTDFSGGRSGGLVFPSLEEFSTVCSDPHSQSFSIINEAEVDVFLEFSCFFSDPTVVGNCSLIPLPFKIQLEHLEVPGSCTIEVWLGEF